MEKIHLLEVMGGVSGDLRKSYFDELIGQKPYWDGLKGGEKIEIMGMDISPNIS